MGGRGKVYVMAALLSGLSAAPLQAQDQRALTRAEQQDWSAIGLIYYGDLPKGAVCTGTLVAPDLVLTAGHCVDASGKLTSLHFAAGWREGAAVAIRSARAVVVAEQAEGKARTLSNDLALIILDEPISDSVIAPLPLMAEERLAETYSFLGYRRSMPDGLGRDDSCTLVGLQQDALLLDCAAVSGNSGGPLLVQTGGTWRLAAVMVARASDGRPQSFAVMPGRDLRNRIAAR